MKMEEANRRRICRAFLSGMTAIIIAFMAFGCDGGLLEMSSEPDANPNTSEPVENPGVNASGGRPDVDPCDGSEELEEVVRYTRSDQFPENGGGSWRGVAAADNEEINPGPGHCFEDYAFGFLQPNDEGGDFNWIVVSLPDWQTDIFPTGLECTAGDAVRLSEPPEVEEMLCSTGVEYEGGSQENGGDPATGGGSDTGGGSGSSGGGASIEEEVGDYYRAAGAEEWGYTFDHLASETRGMFTEEEWFDKSQWLWDRDPLVYHINSINPDGSPYAEVELRITAEDDSSRTQTAFFTFEDGEWKHQLSDAEITLFMPGTPFDEFVQANGGGGETSGGGGEVCAGVSDCEFVDTADVDGDGVLDEVALVGEPEEYSSARTQFTVRVLLADGTTLTREVEVEFWGRDTAWHGATDFGQSPGEELVLGGSSGAHTLFFRVLTYRDGELVELPYPDGDPGAGMPYDALWPIDSAASVNIGVVCDTANSTVVLRSASSVGPGGEGGFEGEETTWVLEGDAWRMVASEPLSYPDGESAFEIHGWQCGDLPRGYD